MKILLFNSVFRAAWYFVKKYMAGRVGPPLLAEEDDDLEVVEETKY